MRFFLSLAISDLWASSASCISCRNTLSTYKPDFNLNSWHVNSATVYVGNQIPLS